MAYIGFPSTVQKYPAKGVPGQKASLNPVVYTDRNYIAGDDAVTVGNFVWADPDNPEPADYHGSGILAALSTGTAGVFPLGIVENTLTFVNDDLRSAGTLVVPKGFNLTTARRGDFFVVASTAATIGQKLFATLADGSIQTGAAGATIAGAIETPWKVEEGGAAGELITVSNWEA
jgi:hypothetical protein